MTEDFRNGITCGVIRAVAYLIRQGFIAHAREILARADIKPTEELSFCSDYDLQELRVTWPEFADAHGNDFVDEQVQPS